MTGVHQARTPSPCERRVPGGDPTFVKYNSPDLITVARDRGHDDVAVRPDWEKKIWRHTCLTGVPIRTLRMRRGPRGEGVTM